MSDAGSDETNVHIRQDSNDAPPEYIYETGYMADREDEILLRERRITNRRILNVRGIAAIR